MANRDLTSSVGKGSSINQAEHDQNMNGLNGTCEEVTGATFTIDYQDHGKTLQFNRGTAIAVTLGTAASINTAMDIGIDNFLIYLKNIGAGVVTVTSTDNIDGALTLVLNQKDSALIQTNDDNTSWNIIARDMDVVDINGGTIDGAVIGGADPAAITGTTIKANTSLELATGETITGIEKVSTNSDTQAITSSGMETYTDAAVAALGSTFTGSHSEERALSSAGSTSGAHGLGAIPDMISVVFECTTTDQGYIAGSIIAVGSTTNVGSTGPSFSVWANTTTLFISIDALPADSFKAADPNGGSTISLDSSDWKIVATAYSIG